MTVAAPPLLWLALTLLAYLAALALHRWSGDHALAHPMLISVSVLGGLLLLTGTPYQSYRADAGLIDGLVGPATVALAIPLYRRIGLLKAALRPLAVALPVGALVAIGSATAIAWALGASGETVRSLAPRSATLPIAVAASELVGGVPALTALAVVVTGISGAVMAWPLLAWLRVEDDAVRGFALGVAAHGIGTARALQESPTAGAFAALGMGLNGVATALLLPLVTRLMDGN